MLKPYFKQKTLEAGCDEAGRGCLAGPVVAAAVILPDNFHHNILNDSKKLTPTQRQQLKIEIKQSAISWAIAEVSNEEIDKINVLNASFLAMHRAIDKLTERPELLLIDGNRFNPYPEIDHQTVIKGDGKFFSIAAASVLAKTYRDELMCELHKDHPVYGWDRNAGYPTKEHRSGIEKHGINRHHRKSFKLLPDQLELF